MSAEWPPGWTTDDIIKTLTPNAISIERQLARCRAMLDLAEVAMYATPPLGAITSDAVVLRLLIKSVRTLEWAVHKLHDPGYESTEEIRERLERERTP